MRCFGEEQEHTGECGKGTWVREVEAEKRRLNKNDQVEVWVEEHFRQGMVLACFIITFHPIMKRILIVLSMPLMVMGASSFVIGFCLVTLLVLCYQPILELPRSQWQALKV